MGHFKQPHRDTLFKTYNAFHTSCVNIVLHGAVAPVTSSKVLEWFYIYGIQFTNNTLLAECLVQIHNWGTLKFLNAQDVMAHAFRPSTGEAEAGGLREFEASLVYRESSRTARIT